LYFPPSPFPPTNKVHACCRCGLLTLFFFLFAPGGAFLCVYGYFRKIASLAPARGVLFYDALGRSVDGRNLGKHASARPPFACAGADLALFSGGGRCQRPRRPRGWCASPATPGVGVQVLGPCGSVRIASRHVYSR